MRYLIVRIGAIGDALITTPLVRYLHSKGHEIVLLASDQTKMIYENNPHVHKLVHHVKDSVANSFLGSYFEEVAKANKCDKIIDLCESIEVRLALSPNYPQWNWDKKDREALCNENYYSFTFEKAGIDEHNIECFGNSKKFYKPEMFFTQAEEDLILDIRKGMLGKKIIMWGLSGSGRQKTYPYAPEVVNHLLNIHEDIKIILVGGSTCQILECGFPDDRRIEKLSGELTFRMSALMAKYADLVVSPDTGFLHASACWDTPKIALLTHTSWKNITGYFTNCTPICSTAPCSPCFRLIDDAEAQCPKEPVTEACLCMSRKHIPPEKVLEEIEKHLQGEKSVDNIAQMSCV